MIITNSLKSSFLSCPYQFYLSYVRRLTPRREPSYFLFGRLVHEVLEALDIGGLVAADKVIVQQRIRLREHVQTKQQIEEADQFLDAMPYIAAAYEKKYCEDKDLYETLSLEKTFQIPLPGGHVFAGKTDKLARHKKDGDVFLWERKTAARTGESYYAALPVDNQLLGYVLSAVEEGHKIQRVLYDVIKKPQLRMRAGETAEAFAHRYAETYILRYKDLFERRFIPIDPARVAAYKQELIDFLSLLDWCIEKNIYPKHHTKYTVCSFLPFCRDGNESLYKQRSVSNLHPELSLEEAD